MAADRYGINVLRSSAELRRCLWRYRHLTAFLGSNERHLQLQLLDALLGFVTESHCSPEMKHWHVHAVPWTPHTHGVQEHALFSAAGVCQGTPAAIRGRANFCKAHVPNRRRGAASSRRSVDKVVYTCREKLARPCLRGVYTAFSA